MAKLWGNGTNGAGKPNWLKPTSRSGNNAGRYNERDNCYATAAGWVLKHSDGTEEVLVAIRGLDLPGKLGVTTIDRVSFSGSAVSGAVSQVKVRFTEQVVVTGNPTLLVTKSTGGTVTATYASINTTKNILTFNLTNPAAANLTIAAQSVVLAGGTIKEAETLEVLTNASLVISAGVATAAGTKAVA